MPNEFEFFIPIEKSGVSIDPATGDVIVDGPMSTVRRDLQGERVLEGAVASGLNTFIRLGMPIDYNHLSVKVPTPKEFEEQGAPFRFIMGEGIEVHDGPAPGGGITPYLKSRLYKGKRATQDALEHFRAGGKLFYSIGGSADRKDGDIFRTNISHIAVTPYPANPDCEIGLVGISALAKSMGLDEPLSAPNGMDRLGSLLDRFETTLEKVLSAGSGAGMGSTGGRTLVTEDLEEDAEPKKKCKCHGKCKCRQDASNADDESPNDSIHDTSDTADRRRRSTKMRKQLDKDTLDGLTALESDPKMGPIAKALAWLGLAKSEKDEDSNDSEGDGETDYSDPDSKGEDGKGDDDEPMGKGFENFPGFDDQVAGAVDVDQFEKQLMAAILPAMDRRFTKLEKAIAGKLDARIEDMKKSLQVATEPTTELLKTLEQFGMRAKPTGAPTGQYQAAESGAQHRSRNEVLDLLEKGAMTGRCQPIDVTNFEIHNILPEGGERLLKSLEG